MKNNQWKQIFVLCILGILFCLPFHNSIASDSFGPVTVYFQKNSYHSPWQKGNSYSESYAVVSLRKGEYLAVLPPQRPPIFAEADAKWQTGKKLYVKKYDSETGLLLLANYKNPLKLPVMKLPRKPKDCSRFFPNKEFAVLEGSHTPLLASRRNPSYRTEVKFISNSGTLCGFSDGRYNYPIKYIRTFLESSKQSPFPHPGFQLESNITSAESKYYLSGKSGALVHSVLPGIGPFYNLFPGDVILSVNGESIVSTNQEDVWKKILFTRKDQIRESGERCILEVYRAGERVEVPYRLKPYSEQEFMIPENFGGHSPHYMIVGGLFFTELTAEYLQEMGEDYRQKADPKLIYLYDHFREKRHPVRRRLLILSKVFPMDSNLGFQNLRDVILESVNGEKVEDLSKFREELQKSDSDFIVLTFSGNKVIVIRRADLQENNVFLKKHYGISSPDNLKNDSLDKK